MKIEPFQVGRGPRSVEVGSGRLFLIAGPCVIESRDSVMHHSTALARISDDTGVPIVFKASFDKANRTSHASFRGIGMEQGLRILEEARAATGLPVLTDVHDASQAVPVAEVVDFLQIPALMLTVSVLAIVIFSAFMLVDLQRVVNGGETNYISATLAIYLDVYNVFANLLAILGIFGGDRE